MSSSHHFTLMSLQSLEENYHEVCHNYLSYFAYRQLFLERAPGPFFRNNLPIISCIACIILDSETTHVS